MSRLFSVIVAALSFVVLGGEIRAEESVQHCTNLQTRTFCEAVRDKRATVVFWGDSITRGRSQIDYPNSWAGLTQSYLKKALPGVDLTFDNLSIDGASVGNMRGDAQPIVNGMPWSEEVEKAKPNLLFIAIGMNSTGDAFHFGQILGERIKFAKSWAVAPTIVLVTPIIPTNAADSPAARPEWVDADAMQIRAIAGEEGVLLADANAAHHYYAAAVPDPMIYLRNGKTGNGINHPSDVGHHQLIYMPVTRLIDRVIEGFN